MRLHYVKKTLYSLEPNYVGADASVWTSVELGYSIIAGAFVYVGPLIRPFANTYRQTSRQDPTGPFTGYGLRSVASRRFKTGNPEESTRRDGSANGNDGLIVSKNMPTLDQRYLRSNQISHTATVSHQLNNDQDSIGSTDSRQMIIKESREVIR